MKPWLLLPPKLAHDLSPIGLQILGAFRDTQSYSWRPFAWRGLKFENRLGIAGGVDKDGARIEDWWKFGPGFIEVGTVTPKAQQANPGKIIDRCPPAGAVWNKMGFPNRGAENLHANLRDLPDTRVTPIFVNIGKNRDTPNERAAEDYAKCITRLDDVADAFVVNISSPNTAGLRDLFAPGRLLSFLSRVVDARNTCRRPLTPLLLKLSPDLGPAELEATVATALDLGIEGFIATNTTLSREPGMPFPTEGGVSGLPLARRSEAVRQQLVQILGPAREGVLVVSVGGLMTPENVLRRLSLGADLVQVYSALIYEGPWFFERVYKKAIEPSA